MSKQNAPLTVDTEIMGVTEIPSTSSVPRYMVHTKHGNILTGGLAELDFRPGGATRRTHPAILTLNSRGHVVGVRYTEMVGAHGRYANR